MGGFIGLIIKHGTNNTLKPDYRQFLLAKISGNYMQVTLFTFEFWANMRYVISDENVNDDIFYLNTILIANHSMTPFDPIMTGSFADYLERFQNTFIFMKKQVAWIPGLGWIASLSSGQSLERHWEKDKEFIKRLCQQFKANKIYKRVTPWCWFSFVEGTRFDQKKLKQSQDFAKQRGYPVYKNILQPRVKGVSYLTHHLYDVLGTVSDVTVLYQPRAPTFYDFFVNTRMCNYVHLHLRVFRQNEIPQCETDNDLGELDQWLRDRWTEKDEIIEKMKKKEFRYQSMKRSPWRAIQYYSFWALVIVYFIARFVFGFEFVGVSLMIIAGLFPVAITVMEYYDNSEATLV